MNRKAIEVGDLSVRAHHLWADRWLVLASGDFAAQNFRGIIIVGQET